MIKNIKLRKKLHEINYNDFPNMIRKDYEEIGRSIRFYTNRGFDYINPYLRGIQSKINEQKYVDDLDKAIDLYCALLKEKNIDLKLKTYRKINIHENNINSFLESLKVGTYTDKGFISTSLLNNYLFSENKRYFKIQFIIELTSLNCGMFVDALSRNMGEKEFIIKRDTVFDIIDVKQKGRKVIVKLKK